MKGFRNAAVAGVMMIAAATQNARAQEISIVMALPAPTLTFAANFIAQDAGIYAKHGLKVSDRNLVGVAATNAVIAGSADFTVGTGATFLRAVANGQNLLAIATLVNKPMVELVIRKDVAEAAGITPDMPVEKRVQALKGKTVAVQGIGSIIHAMQRLAARRGGLDPDKDMRVTPMQPQAMLAALKSRQIDAYATSLPFTTQSIVSGDAVMLVSSPSGHLPEFIPFDYVVLYTRPEVCQKEREKCARTAKALAAAANFINKNPDEALALMKKRFNKLDVRTLEEAWKVVSLVQSKDGRVTKEGLENSQRFSLDAGLLEPKDALKDVTKTFTNEFLQ